MRVILCAGLLLLAACTPSAASETPKAAELQPYWTTTPSPTLAQPALVATVAQPLPSPTPFQYTIASGDTLSQIAEKFRVSLDSLLAANPGIDPNAMPVGKSLKIPSSPSNPSGEGTPTPVPFPVERAACHPVADGGLWCFVLLHNDSSEAIENITAQVTLIDPGGQAVASQAAVLPLDILPGNQSLPISVLFAPGIAPNLKPQVQILTAMRLLPQDPRYLPASVRNTSAQVAWSGLSAQLTGEVFLPAASKSASSVWVAAVAYDGVGNVVGVRRWESSTGLDPGGSLPFSFMISSTAGKIERVDYAIEARP